MVRPDGAAHAGSTPARRPLGRIIGEVVPESVEADQLENPIVDPEERPGEASELDDDATVERMVADNEALSKRVQMAQLRAENSRLQAALEEAEEAQRATPSTDGGRSHLGATLAMRSEGTINKGPRIKEPKPFKGKSVREAREFIRAFKIIFANSPGAYASHHQRVAYAISFVQGDAADEWHNSNDIDDLPEDYTWAKFEEFIYNSVGDETNRTMSAMVAYERARQGADQTAQQFDSELGTLEYQLGGFTENQKCRAFLAKLRDPLRMELQKQVGLPMNSRAELVAYARRYEEADPKLGPRGGTHQVRDSGHKKDNDEGKSRSSGKKSPKEKEHKDKSKTDQSKRKRSASDDLSHIQCYGCKEYGHYKTKCPHPDRWNKSDKPAVRSVAADKKDSKKSKASEKGESL